MKAGDDEKVVNVDHESVLRLAQKAGLTVYDASYVWLARKMGVELLTHDRKMLTAVPD